MSTEKRLKDTGLNLCVSARLVVINPNSVLCSLKAVDVSFSLGPYECSASKSHNREKILEELCISLPSETLYSDKLPEASYFLNRWKHIN